MRGKRTQASGGYAYIAVLVIAAIVIATVTFIFLNRHHKATAPGQQAKNIKVTSYCLTHTFGIGTSGNCVSDIQAMTNYMEHSGLTQCPFVGGASLMVSALYDAQTGAQVRAVQQWAVCYARQEGFTTNVQPTGTVDRATWGELCTYAYTNPSRNGATGASEAIAAGKDAGCAQLGGS